MSARHLVICGAAGAGKTRFLLQLAVALLERDPEAASRLWIPEAAEEAPWAEGGLPLWIDLEFWSRNPRASLLASWSEARSAAGTFDPAARARRIYRARRWIEEAEEPLFLLIDGLERLRKAATGRGLRDLLQQAEAEFGKRGSILGTWSEEVRQPSDLGTEFRRVHLAALDSTADRLRQLCAEGIDAATALALCAELEGSPITERLLGNRFFLSRLARVQRRGDFELEPESPTDVAVERERRALRWSTAVLEYAKNELDSGASSERCRRLGMAHSGDERGEHLQRLVTRMQSVLGSHLWLYGLPAGERLPLDDAFIEPLLRSGRSETTFGPETLPQVIRRAANGKRGLALELIGEAAIGKSTVLAKCARELALQALREPSSASSSACLVPILIDLREKALLRSPSLEALDRLLEFLRREAQLTDRGGWLIEAAEQGRLLCFFDGLDEIAKQSDAAAAFGLELEAWAQALCARGGIVIVSSRPSASIHLAAPFEHWTLRGLEPHAGEPDPVRAFLEKVLAIRWAQDPERGHPSVLELAPQVERWIQRWSREAPLLWEQRRHPLYLLLLAHQEHEHPDAPSPLNVAELLRRGIQQRLRADWRRVGTRPQEALPALRWYDFLRWLAWEWTAEDEIQRGECMDELAERLRRAWQRGAMPLTTPQTSIARFEQRLFVRVLDLLRQDFAGYAEGDTPNPIDLRRWIETRLLAEAPVFDTRVKRIELPHNAYREFLVADLLCDALRGLPPDRILPELELALGLYESARWARSEEILLLLVQLLPEAESAVPLIEVLCAQRSIAGLRALRSREKLPAACVRHVLAAAYQRGSALEHRGSYEGYREYIRQELLGIRDPTQRRAWLEMRLGEWRSYGASEQELAAIRHEAKAAFHELDTHYEPDRPRPEERGCALHAQAGTLHPPTRRELELIRELARELPARATSDLFFLHTTLCLWRESFPITWCEELSLFVAAEAAIFEHFGRGGQKGAPELEFFTGEALPPEAEAIQLAAAYPAFEPAPFSCLIGVAPELGKSNHPIHERRFTLEFQLAALPILEAQLAAFFGESCNPKRSLYPATEVIWFDAMMYARFVHWLCRERADAGDPQRSQWSYDLPTEAEWEYASRGWSSSRYRECDPTLYPWGNHEGELRAHAWYSGDTNPDFQITERGTRRVALGKPGPFGHFDTLGNVWEWTRDAWGMYLPGSAPGSPTAESTLALLCSALEGAGRVRRGGSFKVELRDVSCAVRVWSRPWLRFDDVGFRLVRRRRPS